MNKYNFFSLHHIVHHGTEIYFLVSEHIWLSHVFLIIATIQLGIVITPRQLGKSWFVLVHYSRLHRVTRIADDIARYSIILVSSIITIVVW